MTKCLVGWSHFWFLSATFKKEEKGKRGIPNGPGPSLSQSQTLEAKSAQEVRQSSENLRRK